jgi:hypothetical protein
MRLMPLVALLPALLLGCGASQQQPGGKVFCQSYEDNFLPGCQQVCENDLGFATQDGIIQCQKECRQDLADDDNFNDSCSDRADALQAAE